MMLVMDSVSIWLMSFMYSFLLGPQYMAYELYYSFLLGPHNIQFPVPVKVNIDIFHIHIHPLWGILFPLWDIDLSIFA